MSVVLIVVAFVAVVVIALVAVGRETFTLGHQPKQAHYDLAEAVDWVAQRLPDDSAAALTYDEVRDILRWHLEYLRDRGVPARRDQAGAGGPVFVEDDEGIAYVLGRADDNGLEVTDDDVAMVLELEAGYLAAIGAIGGEVTPPECD